MSVGAITGWLRACMQGMTTLIGTIISSADHTINILYVNIMFLFICSSFAYVYWFGALEFRCMSVEVRFLGPPALSTFVV